MADSKAPPARKYTDADVLRAVAEAKKRGYGELAVQIHEGRIVKFIIRQTLNYEPSLT